jgi:prevent-host-death family protein
MRFAQIVTETADGGERVKITHYGKTIAVLISKEDLQRLQDCDAAREAKRKKAAALGVQKSPPRARVAASGGRK